MEVAHKEREVSQCTCQSHTTAVLAFVLGRYYSLGNAHYLSIVITVFLVLYCFTGHDDIVLCFFCGLAIHRWGPEDDPKTAHARWSTSCSHLWAVEQPSFIQRTLRELENVGAAN